MQQNLSSASLHTHQFRDNAVADTAQSDASGELSKRALDIALSALMLLALLPLLLVLVAAVRSSGSQVLFSHQRIGRNGRAFGCLKLRTMRRDADAVLAQLLQTDPQARREWAATRKLFNDPRITPVGRFLRVTSMDELPQLINVLRGDMSLVGPRPVVRAELSQYYGSEGTEMYCKVRPGITGLWQVSGRSGVGYAERVNLDSTYVRERSFRNDMIILWRTVAVVLGRRGAC